MTPEHATDPKGPISWVRLQMDTGAFDAGPYSDLMDRHATQGIRLCTLAELGDNEANRYRLYELNRECSGDIPGRGPFFTWEEYRAIRLSPPTFDPAGAYLALDGARWVGLAVISNQSTRGFTFSEMTGVVRSHRRRRLALALKVAAMRYPPTLGAPMLRTVQHPGNHVMVSLNRRLGFTDADWPYPQAS